MRVFSFLALVVLVSIGQAEEPTHKQAALCKSIVAECFADLSPEDQAIKADQIHQFFEKQTTINSLNVEKLKQGDFGTIESYKINRNNDGLYFLAADQGTNDQCKKTACCVVSGGRRFANLAADRLDTLLQKEVDPKSHDGATKRGN